MLPKNRKPTHPGKILLEEFLKPLNWSSREFAEKLGGNWSELKVEAIIKGKENLPHTAYQDFANVFGTSPELWQHLQHAYSQWESTHKHNEKGSLKAWKKAQ